MESSSVGKVHAFEEYDLNPILSSALGFLHRQIKIRLICKTELRVSFYLTSWCDKEKG